MGVAGQVVDDVVAASPGTIGCRYPDFIPEGHTWC